MRRPLWYWLYKFLLHFALFLLLLPLLFNAIETDHLLICEKCALEALTNFLKPETWVTMTKHTVRTEMRSLSRRPSQADNYYDDWASRSSSVLLLPRPKWRFISLRPLLFFFPSSWLCQKTSITKVYKPVEHDLRVSRTTCCISHVLRQLCSRKFGLVEFMLFCKSWWSCVLWNWVWLTDLCYKSRLLSFSDYLFKNFAYISSFEVSCVIFHVRRHTRDLNAHLVWSAVSHMFAKRSWQRLFAGRSVTVDVPAFCVAIEIAFWLPGCFWSIK